MKNKTLASYVEEISDDFSSTFSVIGDNTLQNMMSSGECGRVTEIIKKYLPECELEFIKTNVMGQDYDIYRVRVVK